MPGLFPTIEQWDTLNKKSLKHRFQASREWKRLDKAVRAFSVDQANDAKFQDLKTATEAFVALKTGVDGVFHSSRDTNGVISSLRAYVADNPPALTGDEQAAIREVIQRNKQALFRGLQGAQIGYKSGAKTEMAKTLKEDAEEFKDSLLEIPAVSRAAESTPSTGMTPSAATRGLAQVSKSSSNPLEGTVLKKAWDQIIREACAASEAIPEAVLAELRSLIGQQLFDSLSSAVPYLGTIKEGKAVMDHLRKIASHELNTYRVKKSKSFSRPGDVQAAIDAMVVVLNSERVDLGIELAGSSTTFAAGIGTMGADGGTAQVVTSLAITGAKLLRTVYSFVSDHRAMTKANEALKSAAGARLTLLETLQTFPILGAHVIAQIETSTLLDINIADINQPFFKHLAGELSQRLGVTKTSANEILKASRFEVKSTEPSHVEVVRAREQFIDNLQQELNDAILKREIRRNKKNMDAVIRDIPAAAATFQERRDRAAHEAKFKAIAQEAAGKISILEMMVLANLELEAEMARLIDIKAMEEQRLAELNRNKALASGVQRVLDTYKQQTTGFRRFTTRQSDESTAAIQALSRFASSQKYAELLLLRQLTEYLLATTSRTPAGVSPGLRQLNNGSRLHGLLMPVYSSWAATAS